jgi:drug/metabolite transporter (DMT)-like permease
MLNIESDTQRNDSPNTALAALLGCQWLWSLLQIFMKIFNRSGLHPIVFCLWRAILGSVAMFSMVALKLNGKERWGFSLVKPARYCFDAFKSEPWLFAAIGFGSSFHFVCTVLALRYLRSPATFALFQCLAPALSSVFGTLIGVEIPNIVKSAGIVIAIGGAIVSQLWIIDPLPVSAVNEEENEGFGLLFASMQIIALSIYMVLQKRLAGRFDSACITFNYYLIGSVIIVVVAVFLIHVEAIMPYDDVSSYYFAKSPMTGWLVLLYVVLFPSLLGFNALSWATQYLDPSFVTAALSLQPLFTSVLSLVVFGFALKTQEYVGGAMVIIGLFILAGESRIMIKLGYAVTLPSDEDD